MADILKTRWLSNAIILLLLATVFAFVLPFLLPFAWGIWLAILTWPVWRGLNSRLQRPYLSATLMLIGIVLLVGLPIFFIARLSAGELHRLLEMALEANRTGLPMPDWLTRIPVIGNEAVIWWKEHLGKPHGLAELFGAQWKTVSGAARALLSHVGGWAISHVFLLLFSLIVLVTIYIHGERIVVTLRRLAPRIHPVAPDFLLAVPVAVRATAFGMGLIAILEGLVLGAAYGIAGLPSPALLGVITGFMALIPGGAPLSFTLASLFLYVNGHPTAALGLFTWGTVELFLVDKFVRPKLIGHAIQLPFLPVFVGLVGGLQMFGLIGLAYGPAVMLLAVMLWRRLAMSDGAA